MPSFTPHAPSPRSSGVIDSTYNELGGTYDAVEWRYDGFLEEYHPHAAGSVGSFTPHAIIALALQLFNGIFRNGS